MNSGGRKGIQAKGRKRAGDTLGTVRKAAVLLVSEQGRGSSYAHLPMIKVYRGCREGRPAYPLVIVYVYVDMG